LFAQALIHLLSRAFYALFDTKTPEVVGIGSILLNAIFSILFVWGLHLPVWSLGLSTSLASILQALLLFILLQRKIGRFPLNDLVWLPSRMLISAGIMGGILFVLLRLLDQLVFDTTRTLNLLLLTGTVGSVGLVSYLFLCWVFGVGQVGLFISQLKKLKRVRSTFTNLMAPAVEDVEQKHV
jgi:putative peptidoglycan lipid II flippase